MSSGQKRSIEVFFTSTVESAVALCIIDLGFTDTIRLSKCSHNWYWWWWWWWWWGWGWWAWC